ncbi:glycosyltransferase family 4 protein [Paenibacillus sediminis]|uniref:Spore coat protein SA n=1 Tax=Paenibacillus sediminis TaxID=664909 RepID=A0ABS4H5Q6_9BACL|nr:glycosyltransferase family 4 protein [Paenibacillus sediminis]MBP1937874.1 spore coat protein SA [Paenibacillus sediminis]
MNVLMICTEKLPVPPIRGGAIQTYINGVVGLLSKQHKITLLGRTDVDLPREEVVNGIRYVRVDSEGIFELYARGVIEFVRQNHYDVIHIFNRPRLVSLIREAAPNARIILSMHNDMFQPSKISNEEGRIAVEQTERIITISNYIGRTICEYFPQAVSKIRTIYSGVDLDRFVPYYQSNNARQIREQLRSNHNINSKKVILFVGRLSPKKGPHVLIRAMSVLRRSDAVLVVVGGSWYSENRVSDYVAYVRAIAARSPIPVLTTGYVPADQIHHWYWASDIFACTSLWQEPLARVHYEAMAAGLPFITTNRGGNSEIVMNNNGLLIENPEEPGEYVQKLNQLLSDRELGQRMGKNGRHVAEQHFRWNRVASEILAVWKRK